MGEVAEQSEVGGGACISQPPQSLRDSSPLPCGTGEPFLCVLYWVFAFRAMVCYNIMTEISHPKGETI